MVVFKLNATGTALVYSTYLGNSNEGVGGAIAIDSSGDAFVAGEAIGSPATQYPTTTGAYKTAPPSSTGYNIVVTELGPNGDSLIYSTFIAGDAFDNAFGIALDSTDHAYITGIIRLRGRASHPRDDPWRVPDQHRSGGHAVTNVNQLRVRSSKPAANGSSLDYATYVTGSNTTYGHRVAVDSNGDAFLVGQTQAADFPSTAGAFQTSFQGPVGTAYIAEFGTRLARPLAVLRPTLGGTRPR